MKKTLLVVLACVLAIGGAAHAADPLDAAKQLYLSAAYEEALTALNALPPGADPDETDKFRALCLLALNRREEAGKALEGLALRRPLLKFDESESPKFVQLFREARVRVLAPATKAMYVAAKGSFEKSDFEEAKGQFSALLTILAEPELAAQPETADLKMLAEGFARLADQQLERRSAAALPPPVPAPSTATAAPAVGASPARPGNSAAQAPAPRAPQPATQAPARSAASQGGGATSPSRTTPAADAVIFTADDAGVVAAVPVDQRLPPWVPPSNLGGQSFSGLIEVVIDETGKVTSAVVSKSVNPVYDRLLLGAARRWQYRPALHNGRPVKFRRVVAVVLSPTN